MVLFITGRCDRECWYCPIARERKGADRIFANEREIYSPTEAIDEARLMSALGTSITGGEPLLVLDRVIDYAESLKKAYGENHHIHLYTGTSPSKAELSTMKGLVDEIRLHPPQEVWPTILESEFYTSIREARNLNYAVGLEVPALKGVSILESILPFIDFLNINELEWGEISADELRKRRFQLSDGLHNAVKDSLNWARTLRNQQKVHFCLSKFKDSVQLRERLKRIAKNTARPFDEVTKDGTIIYGIFQLTDNISVTDLPLKEGSYQHCGDHVELSWRILKHHRLKLPGKKFIIERYPNKGIVVEMIPV